MSAKKNVKIRSGAAKKRAATDPIDRYRMEAEEIANAKKAMERIRRGVEYQPERMHYVRSLQ